MISKDNNVFSKLSLICTRPGKKIIMQKLFRTKGYKQFSKYQNEIQREFPNFISKFTNDLLKKIKNDMEPNRTQQKFGDKIGSEFILEQQLLNKTKTKLEKFDVLYDRVSRILNSNFVKMTMPVFNALYDAASNFYGDSDQKLRENIVYGHIIAIDLSEPIDRIIDKDEDLQYLNDYKLMSPYILDLAIDKISKCGEKILSEFEKGFKEAMRGQEMDRLLKSKQGCISECKMNFCYKKYRAVMGTAGKNMALCRKPLGEIFYLGMAKAAECVGCGNEIEDTIKNRSIKNPSWPLYYYLLTNDTKKSFDLTIKKSELYSCEAKAALETLPDDFSHKDFLNFLFLTVRHYNHFWHRQILSSVNCVDLVRKI